MLHTILSNKQRLGKCFHQTSPNIYSSDQGYQVDKKEITKKMLIQTEHRGMENPSQKNVYCYIRMPLLPK